MLKLERVKKQYKNFTLDCSLEVKPGCITGLIGQNGAGKSTTFKAALGLIRTDGGTMEVFGKNSRELTDKNAEVGSGTFGCRIQRVSSWKRCGICDAGHVSEI